MSASRGHAAGPGDACCSRSRREQLDLDFRAGSWFGAGCQVESNWITQSRGRWGAVFQHQSEHNLHAWRDTALSERGVPSPGSWEPWLKANRWSWTCGGQGMIAAKGWPFRAKCPLCMLVGIPLHQ